MVGAAAFVLWAPVSAAAADEGVDEPGEAASARAVECAVCVDSYCVGAGAHMHVTLLTKRRDTTSSVAAILATDMADELKRLFKNAALQIGFNKQCHGLSEKKKSFRSPGLPRFFCLRR